MIIFLLKREMQQFFSDVPLKQGMTYVFTDAQYHHAHDVLHLQQETVRLVYRGKAYFAVVYEENGRMKALVRDEDPCTHELSFSFTLALALIRREKMEFALQKAAELGVGRIIPFVSARCIVHLSSEKEERLAARWQTIVQSASAQCKRNVIPVVEKTVSFEDLRNIEAEEKFCAYEKAGPVSLSLSECLQGRSTLVVIGPEGGFSEEEISFLEENQFQAVTLGSRILRAETAAVYAASVISEWDLRHTS